MRSEQGISLISFSLQQEAHALGSLGPVQRGDPWGQLCKDGWGLWVPASVCSLQLDGEWSCWSLLPDFMGPFHRLPLQQPFKTHHLLVLKICCFSSSTFLAPGEIICHQWYKEYSASERWYKFMLQAPNHSFTWKTDFYWPFLFLKLFFKNFSFLIF